MNSCLFLLFPINHLQFLKQQEMLSNFFASEKTNNSTFQIIYFHTFLWDTFSALASLPTKWYKHKLLRQDQYQCQTQPSYLTVYISYTTYIHIVYIHIHIHTTHIHNIYILHIYMHIYLHIQYACMHVGNFLYFVCIYLSIKIMVSDCKA